MASAVYHLHGQVVEHGRLRLFQGSDGYAEGEQHRDFVYVDDVVSVSLWFPANPSHSGIFNTGTGRSQSFNELANAAITWHGRGEIEYIPMISACCGSRVTRDRFVPWSRVYRNTRIGWRSMSLRER